MKILLLLVYIVFGHDYDAFASAFAEVLYRLRFWPCRVLPRLFSLPKLKRCRFKRGRLKCIRILPLSLWAAISPILLNRFAQPLAEFGRASSYPA